MSDSIGVAVVGGTGYGAGELLRLCLMHPELSVVSVVSASTPGTPVAEAHPHLLGSFDLHFSESIDWQKLAVFPNKAVILALPHGTAASYVRRIQDELDVNNAVLFDLSGDFRLSDAAIREQYYPGVSKEEQEQVVYGLPELFRARFRGAQKLSTPGCLANVTTLAALPVFAAEDLSVKGLVVADAKTGTSGAGRGLNPKFHHPGRHDNANAYKVLEHRHEVEIKQNLFGSAGSEHPFMFVPHVIPCSRGCMATVYLELEEEIAQDEIQSRFADFYKDEPFVRVRSAPVEITHVLGSNFCDVSVFARGRQLVCIAVLDNLTKGAAGQAIQNLNIRFELEETLGLRATAIGPC